MNPFEKKYTDYSLVNEMLETVKIVREFDSEQTASVAENIREKGKLFLTGEGSSRIFPAKNLIRKALISGLDSCIGADGSRQASQYDLSDYAVFCASNSGKTREVLHLARKLVQEGSESCYALSSKNLSPLEKTCTETFVLSCGDEKAVAATKSVIEQALFYESILNHLTGKNSNPDYLELADCIDRTLKMPVDPDIVETAANAGTIYFAGYNDGVAEELALKTNEITRRKSDYLEGTYAVHGIEEVMEKDDIVFIVDPIDEEIEKYRDVLIKGVGLKVVAIAERETPFATVLVPDAGKLNPYVFLCAGWNLLVEIGLFLGVNLDKPIRARKIGNEFIG